MPAFVFWTAIATPGNEREVVEPVKIGNVGTLSFVSVSSPGTGGTWQLMFVGVPPGPADTSRSARSRRERSAVSAIQLAPTNAAPGAPPWTTSQGGVEFAGPAGGGRPARW